MKVQLSTLLLSVSSLDNEQEQEGTTASVVQCIGGVRVASGRIEMKGSN